MIERCLSIVNGHWLEKFGLGALRDCHLVCCREIGRLPFVREREGFIINQMALAKRNRYLAFLLFTATP